MPKLELGLNGDGITDMVIQSLVRSALAGF
jgi:hypothetical protein